MIKLKKCFFRKVVVSIFVLTIIVILYLNGQNQQRKIKELQNKNYILIEKEIELDKLINNKNKEYQILRESYDNCKNNNIWDIVSTAYNIDKYILQAIAIHETGNFKSDAWINKNNPAGIMDSSTGKLKLFETKESAIIYFAMIIKYNYIDKGLNNLNLIQTKYAPIGVSNDPTNLNQYWVKSTTEIYNKLKNGTIIINYSGILSYE